MMRKLRRRRPSPAMIVALVALVVALGGTSYAAGRINGNSIRRQSIGGGKLEPKTLTDYQINLAKLAEVPPAERTTHTFWAVVHSPAGPDDATLARASDAGVITATEAGGAVDMIFPIDVSDCADVADRNNDGTLPPVAGYAQTNGSPANLDAIEVHTKDKGDNEDSDFSLIVVCPWPGRWAENPSYGRVFGPSTAAPRVTSSLSATVVVRGEHRRTAGIPPSDATAPAPAYLVDPAARGLHPGPAGRRGAGPGGDEDDPLPTGPSPPADPGEDPRQALQAGLAERRRGDDRGRGRRQPRRHRGPEAGADRQRRQGDDRLPDAEELPLGAGRRRLQGADHPGAGRRRA